MTESRPSSAKAGSRESSTSTPILRLPPIDGRSSSGRAGITRFVIPTTSQSPALLKLTAGTAFF